MAVQKKTNGKQGNPKSLIALLTEANHTFQRDRSPRKQAEFIENWQEIDAALKAGWNPKAVWTALRNDSRISFTYKSMLRFIELQKKKDARVVSIPLDKLGAVGQLAEHPGWFHYEKGDVYLNFLARHKLLEFAMAVKEVVEMRRDLFPDQPTIDKFANEHIEEFRGLISTRNFFAERPEFFPNSHVHEVFIDGQKKLFAKLEAIDEGKRGTMDFLTSVPDEVLVYLKKIGEKHQPEILKKKKEDRASLLKFFPLLQPVTTLIPVILNPKAKA